MASAKGSRSSLVVEEVGYKREKERSAEIDLSSRAASGTHFASQKLSEWPDEVLGLMSRDMTSPCLHAYSGSLFYNYLAGNINAIKNS